MTKQFFAIRWQTRSLGQIDDYSIYMFKKKKKAISFVLNEMALDYNSNKFVHQEFGENICYDDLKDHLESGFGVSQRCNLIQNVNGRYYRVIEQQKPDNNKSPLLTFNFGYTPGDKVLNDFLNPSNPPKRRRR